MTQETPQKLWLPYFVGGFGVLGSLLFWYYLWNNLDEYFLILHSIKEYLAWIALFVGISFSLLLAFIIKMAESARFRNIQLHQVNENLKKEIHERINAEDSKQKLEIALLQGQKLQSIGTLAGGIAHDFNNILYAINGYVEMARDDVPKDSVVYKNLGRVLEGTLRGRELIARILAFSRRQQNQQFNPVPLKEGIEAALGLLKPTIPASVIIDFKSDGEFTVLGNQTQIHQVLVNMINNAVDAMDGEGTININMTHISSDDPILKQIPETKGQKYCKIEISDTGHGMDQHTMERMFEPFYTTKEVGKGTGLGLSIVHSIIKEHQGEITVNSQLGRGTTFTILLPEYSAATV